MTLSRRDFIALGAGTGLTIAQCGARAEFSDHPIRIIVPYSPGGPATLLTRFLAIKLQETSGQSVIVENKPGAGLAVGAQVVANSAPDGYTLLVNASSMYVPSSLGGRTPTQNLKDFAPISVVGGFPLVLVCNTRLDVRSVGDLIGHAKSRPHQLTYGSSGTGSLTHLAAALFAHMAGVQMLHVPYRGISEALVDVAAGRVDIAFGGLPTTLPLVSAGKMRSLAVTSLQRTAVAPQLPTIAESGLPGYEVNPWYGIVVPSATPAAITAKLHQELAGIMQSPEVREKWKAWGADATYSPTPGDFAALMQSDTAKWAAFIKQSGIKLE